MPEYYHEDKVGEQPFVPLNPKPGIGTPRLTEGPREPVEGGAIYNPYGITRAGKAYGKSMIAGGPEDLLRSVATRSLAIEGLKAQMEKPAVPQGLQSGLEQYAARSGNPYLQAMLQNYMPNIQTQATIQNQAQKSKLNELLTGAYVLGGGLWGGQAHNWAMAKEQDKARKAARTAELQGIVGGLMRGLGLNQYGEADTTQGAIGVFEM